MHNTNAVARPNGNRKRPGELNEDTQTPNHPIPAPEMIDILNNPVRNVNDKKKGNNRKRDTIEGKSAFRS